MRDQIKRWGPVIATAVLVLNAALRVAAVAGWFPGGAHAADGIESVANLVGLSPDAALVADVGVLSAAFTGAGVGIVRKIRSQIAKARGPQA